MDRQAKGIWIPLEIWQDQSLSWNEKILLMEVDSFTSKGVECFFSNEYISELLGINESNANRTLSSLITKGYIKKTRFDGRRRFIQSCLQEQSRVAENGKADLLKTARQGCRQEQYNKEDIINKEKINTTCISRARETFVIPSLDEVRAYCTERANGIDAEAFVDHYTANGWMVGRTKMRDWKAAVRNWEKSHKQFDRKPQAAAPEKDDWFHHNLREMGITLKK